MMKKVFSHIQVLAVISAALLIINACGNLSSETNHIFIHSNISPSAQETIPPVDLPTAATKTPSRTPTIEPPRPTATMTRAVLPTATPTNARIAISSLNLPVLTSQNIRSLAHLGALKPESTVQRFAFTPDSSRIVIATGTTHGAPVEWVQIFVWNLQSGEQSQPDTHMLDFYYVDALAIDPTGKTAAIGAGFLKLMDFDTGEITDIPLDPFRRSDIIQISYSPSGDRIAAGFALTGLVAVLDTHTWEVLFTSSSWFPSLPTSEPSMPNSDIRALAFSPDGKQLAVSDVPGGVVVLDATTGKVLLKITIDGEHGYRDAWSLEYSRDGKSLIIDDGNGRILIWDLATNSARQTLINPDVDLSFPGIPKVLVSKEGDLLFSYPTGSNTIYVWDIGREQVLHQFTIDVERIDQMILSPDGKVLAVEGNNVLHFYGVP